MAWPTGQPRPPGAGRKKGSLNKQTVAVRELLASLDCNPIELLAWIAKGDVKSLKLPRGQRISVEARLKAVTELLDRMYPKLRAIEVSGSEEASVRYVLEVPPKQTRAGWEDSCQL